MTIKALYPTVRPTLNLDFAKTKRLDPRVTFTRVMTGASVATFVGADGLIKTAGNNVPRFDHNPTTGESLGLLVEGAATNSITDSNAPGFNIGGTGMTVSTAGVGLDNTTAARQVVVSTTQENYRLSWHGFSGSASNVRSFYVKVLSGTGSIIYGQGGSGDEYAWNIATLTYTSDARHPTGGIISVGNGWYRCWVGPNGPSGGSAATANPQSVGTYLFWGFQNETGSFPTSYIPTSGSTVTRAADVATLSNANSSIFPTSAFTTVNTPFGTAGGGSTVKLVGPTIKRTAIYDGDLPQAQINTLTNTGDFWRWRVLGSTFALPNFTTNGSVTVDWGDGVVETLTTGVHTFTNGGGYHDIGFRLNSGTFFRPFISGNGTYKDRVIAVGPAPASMKVDGVYAFQSCTALRSMDGYADYTGGTSFNRSWELCSSLTQFPLINTTGVTGFDTTWSGCSGLTSFPLINTSSGTYFYGTWSGCSGLTLFPPINTGAATNFTSTWQNCSSLASFPFISTNNVTNFNSTWQNCSSLTSFPLINTALGTGFGNTWSGCSSLTSFPLINTAAGTSFQGTWANCSSLTSFPLLNTAVGANFSSAWVNCSSLTSFPLINTALGTAFSGAWSGCSGLTSFPLINTASGGNFYETWWRCSSLTSFPALSFNSATSLQSAWQQCTQLASFPANMFNTTGVLASNAFSNAFLSCALTAASIENILTSLVTNGQSNITLGVQGGTNAGAATWTTAANTAYATLISRGWTITRNP